MQPCIEAETEAIQTLADALAGSGKPFVHAGLTPMEPGHISTEDDPDTTDGPVGGRGRNSQTVLNLADQGVRSSVVRLPRSVHQRATHYGFCSVLIAAARKTGVSMYVGDGTQRWPAVNRLDAARLFRIALEDAAPGTVLHAVADEGDTMRWLAEAIGDVLAVPVESTSPDNLGLIGRLFALDMPSSSALTQKRFGWEPTHPSLMADLAAGDYRRQALHGRRSDQFGPYRRGRRLRDGGRPGARERIHAVAVQQRHRGRNRGVQRADVRHLRR